MKRVSRSKLHQKVLFIATLCILGFSAVFWFNMPALYATRYEIEYGADGRDLNTFPNILSQSGPEAFQNSFAKNSVIAGYTNFQKTEGDCTPDKLIKESTLNVSTFVKTSSRIDIQGTFSNCILENNLFDYAGGASRYSFFTATYKNEFTKLDQLKAESLDCVAYKINDKNYISYAIRVSENSELAVENYDKPFNLSCTLDLEPGEYNLKYYGSSTSTVLKIE